MNSIFIVLPILTLLMFDLGLTLKIDDFKYFIRHPRSIIVGLTGQLIFLPLIAAAIALILRPEPWMFVGFMLIACCPGGSSSNVFSKLVNADVALSVSLTACSSVITLFTIPLILSWATSAAGGGEAAIHLPIGKLLIQNVALMLVPIVVGMLTGKYAPQQASAIDRVLARCAFPALMLLAGIYFVQNYAIIISNFNVLGIAVAAMMIIACVAGGVLAVAARLKKEQRRTIVIEVGMQNAAQAIAIASGPFVFHDSRIAAPAIIYALVMNIVLLSYVAICRKLTFKTA